MLSISQVQTPMRPVLSARTDYSLSRLTEILSYALNLYSQPKWTLWSILVYEAHATSYHWRCFSEQPAGLHSHIIHIKIMGTLLYILNDPWCMSLMGSQPIIRHGSIHQPATLQLCGTVIFCPIAVKIQLYLTWYLYFLGKRNWIFLNKCFALFYVTISKKSSFFVNSLLKK